MKILLEGPDCVGKTTLAKTLRLALDAIYIHLEYEPDDEKYEKQNNYVFNLLKSMPIEKNVIIDRFLPSEQIYGTVFRGISRIEYDDISYLRKFDQVIFCLPKNKQEYLDLFEKVSKTREEYSYDLKKISELYNRYNDMYISAMSNYINEPLNISRYDLFDNKHVTLN